MKETLGNKMLRSIGAILVGVIIASNIGASPFEYGLLACGLFLLTCKD